MALPARDVLHPDLTTTGGVVLVARGLRLGHGREAVIGSMDLTVREGERWALLGRNGSGKSTFVRTLLGETPALGGVLGLNRDLVLDDGVGAVPQRLELSPWLPTTVREFADLGLEGTGLRGAARRARVAETLDRLGLAALAQRDLRRCSGGERQRALLARALVREPRLLVLDEPTAALDAAGEAAFDAAVTAELARRPLTLLLVTHEPTQAARWCSQGAWFGDGSVDAGPLAEVLARHAGAAP